MNEKVGVFLLSSPVTIIPEPEVIRKRFYTLKRDTSVIYIVVHSIFFNRKGEM